jgi:hypothetical protein
LAAFNVIYNQLNIKGQGEEVLHLPTIVESAVASPNAAAAACSQIKKFLSKENYTRPHVQYNAIMLIRILADNPGHSFTKNMDKGFADTMKHLLRNGRDPSVGQILRETLDALERDKAYDTNLGTVFTMWRKEKGLMASAGHPKNSFGLRTLNAPPWNGSDAPPGVASESYGRHSRNNVLPPPVELTARVEEARTSAKLLLQLVQSTPPNELLENDLVKEFADRCLVAQRSVQNYINCDNPSPDDDTMLTLIETNEQLSLAASKHQRAVLQARRIMGSSPVATPPLSTINSENSLPALPSSGAPQLPPLPQTRSMSPRDSNPMPSYTAPSPIPLSLQAAPHRTRTTSPTGPDDPFSDHGSNAYDHPAPPMNVPPPPPPRESVRRLSEREADFQSQNSDLGLGGANSSPTNYSPGYTTTPSYLQRQKSAGDNVTMHGGASPPRGGVGMRGGRLTEEEEYARDYPTGGAPHGRREQEEWSAEPRTPEQRRLPVGAGRGATEDVSPVAERGQVTYRY